MLYKYSDFGVAVKLISPSLTRTCMTIKTPTGRRQTSWLFTKLGGHDSGITQDKPRQWSEWDLNPEHPACNSSMLTTETLIHRRLASCRCWYSFTYPRRMERTSHKYSYLNKAGIKLGTLWSESRDLTIAPTIHIK